jgi:hypothetical protein
MDRIRPELQKPLAVLQYALDAEEAEGLMAAVPAEEHGAFYGRLLLAMGEDEIRHITVDTDAPGDSASAVVFTDRSRIHVSVTSSGEDEASISVVVRPRRPLGSLSVETAPDISKRDTYYTWPQGSVLALHYADGIVRVSPRRYVRDSDREVFLSFLDSIQADLTQSRPVTQ